jgi:hypothetical protein
LENKKIPNKGKVYLEFKEKYPTQSINDLETYLSKIKGLAKYYNKLINPKNEVDNDIRIQLEYINRLEINVAYPFLIKVFDDYVSSVIDKPTFIKVLELIQSFTWRRFILGLPTNALNKIFMTLYDKVEIDNYLFSIQKTLIQRTGVQRFPKNSEVVDSLKVKDLYNIKSKNRIYMFDRLENFENTERVTIDGNSLITIEHIFPQNPDPKWKIDLGDNEYSFIKENYLNTIGNLTLSGNNGKLSNRPFLNKRDMKDAGYKDSRLWLNKHLSTLEKWDRDEIEKRSDIIAERFLKIWEFPKIEIELSEENDEVNIFEADDPTHKRLEYAIFFDQKIGVTQVSKLYVEVMRQLFELQPESFFTTELYERLSMSKNKNENGLRQPILMNDTYYIEGNIDNNGKFDRIKQALTIFGFEDELLIKYAENGGS